MGKGDEEKWLERRNRRVGKKEKWGKGGKEGGGKVKPLPNKNSGYGPARNELDIPAISY